jgi:malonyl-CoA/methylmalonyl-CoA synthetase
VTFLSILARDAVAVPLAPTHPVSELQYVMDNSQASMLLCSEKYKSKALQITRTGECKNISVDNSDAAGENVKFGDGRLGNAGLMLYTSGTTSRPKVRIKKISRRKLYVWNQELR